MPSVGLSQRLILAIGCVARAATQFLYADVGSPLELLAMPHTVPNDRQCPHRQTQSLRAVYARRIRPAHPDIARVLGFDWGKERELSAKGQSRRAQYVWCRREN